MKRLIVTLTALVLSSGVYAVQPDERLADANLEQRAREVSKALRCVVCQNETIDDSSAELARDMRILVRARITAGDTNEQVLAYMVQSYGDFVLLRPRLTIETLILWFGPLLVLMIGGGVILRRLRRPAAAAPVALSEDDARALKEITGKEPHP